MKEERFFLIMTTSFREAEDFARSQKLTRKQWKLVRRYMDVFGYSGPKVVFIKANRFYLVDSDDRELIYHYVKSHGITDGL